MNSSDIKVAEMKVQRAVLAVSLDLQFYAGLLLSLPGGVILDDTCDTAYTDGRLIGFNPELVLQMTPYGVKFVLVHEICHIMLKHHLRKGNRDHSKYNRAADFVIHDNMFEDGWKILNWVLFDSKYSNMTTEMVYKLLPDDPSGDETNGAGDAGTMSGDKPKGVGSSGIGEVRPMKNKDGSDMTEPEKAAEAQEIDIIISQSLSQAKACGKGTAGQQRFCDEILEPKVAWQEELRMYLESHARNDYNWSQPNRRYTGMGIYLPTLKSENMQDMVFFIDTSGSVSKQELKQFMTEISAILSIFMVRIWVVYVDTIVHNPQEFNSQEYWRIEDFKPAGFGGTDFRPGFEWVEEQGIQPAVAVYLTDLDCRSFPDEQPDYDVLWCCTSPWKDPEGSIPWGRFIQVDMD